MEVARQLRSVMDHAGAFGQHDTTVDARVEKIIEDFMMPKDAVTSFWSVFDQKCNYHFDLIRIR